MKKKKLPKKGYKKGGKLYKAELGDPIGFDPNGNPISMNPANVSQSTTGWWTAGQDLGQGPINQEMSQLPAGTNNLPPDPKRKQRGYSDYVPGLGFNPNMAIHHSNLAANELELRNQAEDAGTLTPEGLKRSKIGVTGHDMATAGYAAKGAINTAMNVAGLIGKERMDRLVKMDEQQRMLLMQRDRAENIYPERGDDSELGGGTNDALAKYGKKLKMAKYGISTDMVSTVKGPSHKNGGQPVNINQVGMTGEDMNSSREDGMVEAQGGEGIAVRGGEGYIFSKEKEMAKPKSEYLSELSKLIPIDGGASLALFAEGTKRKKDSDRLTFADAVKPFNTDKDKKIELKLKEKILKGDELSSDKNRGTGISRVTATLNNKYSFIPELEDIQATIELKNLAPMAIISEMNENAKKSKSTIAKYGKRLRKAASGDSVEEGVPVVPQSMLSPTILDPDPDLSFNTPDLMFTSQEQDPNYDPNIYNQIPFEVGERSSTTPITPVTPSATTPGTNSYGVGNIGQGYTSVDKSGNITYDPSDITDFRRKLYSGNKFKSPYKDQAGFVVDFNRSGFESNPKDAMDMLTKAGFTPNKGSWKDTNPEDVQEFLLGKDKENNYSVMRQLWDTFKNTEQGRQWLKTSGLDEGTTFDELGDEGIKNFFQDDKYGIRTGLATLMLSKPITKPASKEESKKLESTYKFPSAGAPITGGKKRLYYEGLNPLQVAAPWMDLLASKQPVPYIEDQGAKDAYAMGTRPRFTDIQPQLNRITRAKLAATRNNGATPVEQARAAQMAANAYEAANQVYGQKYNMDNQIEANFKQRQQELRMRAGANKAQALDTLAQRTATRDWKDYAMFRNAVGEIGNKQLQNLAENRASMLYQDMFPNVGYNGISTNVYGTGIPLIGGAANYGVTSEADLKRQKAYIAAMQGKLAQEAYDIEYGESKKNGGKIKMSKKSVKIKR